MSKSNLTVLFGGRSSEYEVSLQSAFAVISNLNYDKYELNKIGITKDGKWFLFTGSDDEIRDNTWKDDTSNIMPVFFDPSVSGRSPFFILSGEGKKETVSTDIVFPVLHGSDGEGGAIQGMLETADMPVVSCDHTSSGNCMDKTMTKKLAQAIGVHQARSLIIDTSFGLFDLDGTDNMIKKAIGYPVFVKPARSGSSVGISKASTKDELNIAVKNALKEDCKILIEEAIKGKEVEVAVLEEHGIITVSKCGEIDPGNDFYDYDTKYINDTAKYYIPARISSKASEEIRTTAKRLFESLGCSIFSRLDFFVDDKDVVTFNEINTIPGFTSISMYPKLMMDTGMSFSDLLERMIEAAK